MSWKYRNQNQNFFTINNPDYQPTPAPVSNNWRSGPLMPNGKTWKEVRNEQRQQRELRQQQQAKKSFKPMLRSYGTKIPKKTLTRSNGQRNLFRTTRKNRR